MVLMLQTPIFASNFISMDKITKIKNILFLVSIVCSSLARFTYSNPSVNFTIKNILLKFAATKILLIYKRLCDIRNLDSAILLFFVQHRNSNNNNQTPKHRKKPVKYRVIILISLNVTQMRRGNNENAIGFNVGFVHRVFESITYM